MIRVVALFAALFLTVDQSGAGIITANVGGTGSYNSAGTQASPAFAIATLPGNDRGYFVFNLGAESGTVSSAILHLTSVATSSHTDAPAASSSITLSASTVTSVALASLVAGTGGVPAHTDLGDDSIGSSVLGFGAAGLAAGTYSVTLSNAVIQAALGGSLGLGGYISASTGVSGFGDIFFGGTTNTNATLEIVYQAAAVPEPSSLMALSGLAAVIGFRRVRRSRSQVV